MRSTHSILEAHQVPTDLVADLTVPVLTGMQRQGDVLVRPRRPGKGDTGTVVGPDGVPVVRGEAGGNTHLLVAVEGTVEWKPNGTDLAIQGTVTVASGSQAGLIHPEHGLTLIGAGCYTVERQTEQADELRLVAD